MASRSSSSLARSGSTPAWRSALKGVVGIVQPCALGAGELVLVAPKDRVLQMLERAGKLFGRADRRGVLLIGDGCKERTLPRGNGLFMLLALGLRLRLEPFRARSRHTASRDNPSPSSESLPRIGCSQSEHCARGGATQAFSPMAGKSPRCLRRSRPPPRARASTPTRWQKSPKLSAEQRSAVASEDRDKLRDDARRDVIRQHSTFRPVAPRCVPREDRVAARPRRYRQISASTERPNQADVGVIGPGT